MLVSAYFSRMILFTFLKDLGITQTCTGAEIHGTGPVFSLSCMACTPFPLQHHWGCLENVQYHLEINKLAGTEKAIDQE